MKRRSFFGSFISSLYSRLTGRLVDREENLVQTFNPRLMARWFRVNVALVDPCEGDDLDGSAFDFGLRGDGWVLAIDPLLSETWLSPIISSPEDADLWEATQPFVFLKNRKRFGLPTPGEVFDRLQCLDFKGRKRVINEYYQHKSLSDQADVGDGVFMSLAEFPFEPTHKIIKS